jgi:hypothetical protein
MNVKIPRHLRDTVKKKHPEKWVLKHFVSSEQQRTCISVFGDQKVPCQTQCGGFGAFAIFSGLATARLFPVFSFRD